MSFQRIYIVTGFVLFRIGEFEFLGNRRSAFMIYHTKLNGWLVGLGMNGASVVNTGAWGRLYTRTNYHLYTTFL